MDINADRTKLMSMSRNEKAGIINRNIKT